MEETSTEPSYWPQPTVCNVGEFFELGTEANPIVIDDEAHPPHMIPDAPVTYADDEFNSVADTEIIATPEFWEKLIDESFTAMSTPEHEGAQHVHSTSLSANISPTGCNAFEEREHSRKPSAPPGDMDDEALKGSDGSHASGNSFGPANTNPENATEYQALPPVDVGIEEYEVKRVLDSHLEQRGCQEPCLFYTVEWVGYNEPSYEPAEYLENAREVVSDFHRRCPEKPGPSSKGRCFE
ncbi:hypothetical protein N7492_002166 [Penicillium capsulatum]|uniref:Chromo domain-containing protein n=1 Tax=Penicillium capsulatum TaxID=69766 RepID=A0A9W9IKX4_9EURO|nr:hypothetical protein N7492_002166 [Penicillium capsulatum]KAJ6123224.1 hypothetical protein N7512_005689 [Penicillium capsulatum]